MTCLAMALVTMLLVKEQSGGLRLTLDKYLHFVDKDYKSIHCSSIVHYGDRCSTH